MGRQLTLEVFQTMMSKLCVRPCKPTFIFIISKAISKVKGVMMENIEKVLDRAEKIELLVDKTENLHNQAQDFRNSGTKICRKMWLQNMKTKLIVLGILIELILIIVLSVCHGFNCGK
ncbi:hypothetical protein L6164_036882 [Bauhinia variegata]|uniref:Uncharacterized protein n=1 Tax=Bauhinia variegata TaxID=167791 RepID=A0ACB9KIF1_BAUVA|nr:hypothetical protein L6164_036882 [Bauhinia variegata]